MSGTTWTLRPEIGGVDVEEFIKGYIDAMLWSSNDESTPEGGEPFDKNYDVSDLTLEASERIEIECRAFLYRCGYLIREENYVGTRRSEYDGQSDAKNLADYAGHDFWLTRVGHGAGFWDGDWAEYPGELMTKVSKSFGEINPYVTDDKRVGLE